MIDYFDRAFDELMKYEEEDLKDKRSFYRKNLWEKYNYHLIYQPEIAVKVFVTAVNIGADMANRLLQEAICLCSDKIKIDGDIGKETLSNLNKVNKPWFMDCYRVLVAKCYVEKASYDRNKIKYIIGWMRRALA